jgi:polygalacturonase
MPKINFLKLKIVALVIVVLSSCASKSQKLETGNDNWSNMYKIISAIKEPVFSKKVFNVTTYGAIGDGKFDNSLVFKKAIEECTKNGGGIVNVPSGKYYTGPIHLDNNVNLHLEEGCEILFSTNPKDFPIVHTSFEGTELMNYSPLIYAFQKTNVAVTGKGTLNGQAKNENWWSWCGKDVYGWKKGAPVQNVKRLMDMAENGVPVAERVFGEGFYLRPSFIEFFDCKNVLLKEFKIVNAPFWILHPIKATNVIVDGVYVQSHGPNNDGCDPEYSKNVIIRNCTFDTGDDCIAIKSGRDNDGRRVGIKSENIIVQNCKMFDGHGGVTIGSEISAGVSNVYVENCDMDSPELDRAIRIKTNTRRGGTTENVFVRNLKIGQVKESVLGIDMFYTIHGNQTGNFIPTVQNIYLENITVKNGGDFGILVKGLEQSPVKNIVFKNVTIDKVKTNISVNNVEGLQFVNTKMNGILIENSQK